MEDFMEDFQKISKKALETPFWKISKSFMELFPCELGDPIEIPPWQPPNQYIG